MPLGGLAGGALGASLGLHATLLLGAIGLLTPAAWLIFSPVRGLHALEEIEPAPTAR
jgi:hypothetical protein